MELLFSSDMSLFGDQLAYATSTVNSGGAQSGDGWISDGQISQNSSRSSSPILPKTQQNIDYDVAEAGLDWLEGNINLLEYLGADQHGCHGDAAYPDTDILGAKSSRHATSSAVQILADLAAENAAELDAGTPPGVCTWSNTDIP